MECGVGGQPHKTPHFYHQHKHPPPERPFQEEPGSGLTASAPVSDVSAPACTNGVWPPLRPVSVAQKNKPSTMSSSNVQSKLPVLDDETTEWLLNTRPEIQRGQAVDKRTRSNEGRTCFV